MMHDTCISCIYGVWVWVCWGVGLFRGLKKSAGPRGAEQYTHYMCMCDVCAVYTQYGLLGLVRKYSIEWLPVCIVHTVIMWVNVYMMGVLIWVDLYSKVVIGSTDTNHVCIATATKYMTMAYALTLLWRLIAIVTFVPWVECSQARPLVYQWTYR